MQAFFMESNTVLPFFVINRTLTPSLEVTPPSSLHPIQRGNVFIKTPLILHCNPMLHFPQHACKHFYGIQHSSTFIIINRVSSPSLEPHPLLLSIHLQEGNVSIKTPLILHCNPMLQPPNMHASIFTVYVYV